MATMLAEREERNRKLISLAQQHGGDVEAP